MATRLTLSEEEERKIRIIVFDRVSDLWAVGIKMKVDSPYAFLFRGMCIEMMIEYKRELFKKECELLRNGRQKRN